MGSYCELTIADKSICWGKNSVDPVMMSIFSAQDKQYRYEKISEVFPEDFEEDDETPFAICKYISRVSVVKKRLDILSFSLSECEKSLKACVDAEIEYFEQYLANNDNDDLLFKLYTNDKNTLSVANVESFVNAYKTIFKLTNDLVDAENKFRDSGGLLGYVTNSTNEYAFGIPVNDFRFSLRILLECFEEDAPVELDLSDLIEGGWYAYEDDLVEMSRNALTASYHYDSKIIILTEGSSDKNILEKSLSILYPEYFPYYAFMDFGASNSSGGASALTSVVKAFLGANIQNRIIALFDNDTAARVAMKSLASLKLPDNMRVMTYPTYEFLECYPTIGPSGKHTLDVNQLAGSIELYLCKQALEDNGEISPVQWKGFDQSLSCYQGEVLNKAAIQKKFYSIVKDVTFNPSNKELYDWQGLELILQTIFKAFESKNN